MEKFLYESRPYLSVAIGVLALKSQSIQPAVTISLALILLACSLQILYWRYAARTRH